MDVYPETRRSEKAELIQTHPPDDIATQAGEDARHSITTWLIEHVFSKTRSPEVQEAELGNGQEQHSKLDENLDIDALLAKELNQLSVDEREIVYEEIHGVDQIQEETKEFLDEKLDALDRELRKISNKPAYELAERSNKTYVLDRKLRLMFLRAEHFNSPKAAGRLVRFMEGKLELFGKDLLARPVYYSDLDVDDQEALKSGKLQCLPVRDRAGRSILCDFLTLSPRCYKRTENMLKAMFYFFNSMVEDEETQRRGVVGIIYSVGQQFPEKIDFDFHSRAPRLFEWLPVRFSAMHLCSDDPRIRAFNAVVLPLLGKHNRARFRIHHGTHTECQYSLMTFGVPVHILPVTYTGELKPTIHSKWIAKRKTKDAKLEMTGVFAGIDIPGQHDVLLGRGKTTNHHSGNVRMRSLVDLHMDEYDQAPVGDKHIIVDSIVKAIQKGSGRFLSQNPDGWWIEVSGNHAFQKVSNVFRTERSTRARASRISSGPDRKKRTKIDEPGKSTCLSFCRE